MLIPIDSYERLQNLELMSKVEKSIISRLEVSELPSSISALYFFEEGGRFGLDISVPAEWAASKERHQARNLFQTVRKEIVFTHNGSFLRFTLEDPELLRTFSSFLDSLIERLASEKGNVGELALRIHDEWAELFLAAKTPIPSVNKQAGLVAELLVLQSLLKSRKICGFVSWTGPEGAPHDFEGQDWSIECKATLSNERFEIEVSNLEQLDSIDGKILDLVLIRLQADPNGALSIPMLTRNILRLGTGNQAHLMEKIAKSGLSIELLAEEHLFEKFNMKEVYEFAVGSDFPRLETKSSSWRVGGVRFRLDLANPETVPGFRHTNLYF